MQIEIIGYDTVNGSRTACKHFKSRFVSSTEELEAERAKIRRRQERKHGEHCEIFLKYRTIE
jgi:hypothetical protein